MFINTFENSVTFRTLFALFYVHVSASSSEEFDTLNFFDFFVKYFLILGKMLESPWRSECSWRLIFEPPKIAKVELWFERELNFGNFR